VECLKTCIKYRRQTQRDKTGSYSCLEEITPCTNRAPGRRCGGETTPKSKEATKGSKDEKTVTRASGALTTERRGSKTVGGEVELDRKKNKRKRGEDRAVRVVRAESLHHISTKHTENRQGRRGKVPNVKKSKKSRIERRWTAKREGEANSRQGGE